MSNQNKSQPKTKIPHPPNETIYIRNLNEKLSKDGMYIYMDIY